VRGEYRRIGDGCPQAALVGDPAHPDGPACGRNHPGQRPAGRAFLSWPSCACGEAHAAGRPEGVPDSAVSIGPNLRALVVYLVVFQRVPLARCAQLISDVTGAEVSAGFIHSCLAKAAGVVADVVKLIKTRRE
jgi:Transposase IS66 family